MLSFAVNSSKLINTMKSITLYLITFLSIIMTSTYSHAHDAPERIVVSGGSITEIIYALGEQDRIVGVDSTSVYPAQAKEKPQVGYVRRITAEGILSLKPDLLLGEADTGPKKVVEQLKRANIAMHLFDKTDNFANIEKKVRKIAQLLHVEKKGDKLVEQLQQQRKQLADLLAKKSGNPKVLFVLGMRSGQPIVAGKGTSAAEVITAAGGNNIASEFIEGWKPLATEATIQMNPDVIISMGSTGSHMNSATSKLAKLPHFKYTNAVKNQRIYEFDGSALLGMSPRTIASVIELANALHSKAEKTTQAK